MKRTEHANINILIRGWFDVDLEITRYFAFFDNFFNLLQSKCQA